MQSRRHSSVLQDTAALCVFGYGLACHLFVDDVGMSTVMVRAHFQLGSSAVAFLQLTLPILALTLDDHAGQTCVLSFAAALAVQ